MEWNPVSLLMALLLSACGGAEDNDAMSEGDGGPNDKTRALLAGFLAVEGENIDSCFEGLPELDTTPANEQFAEREGWAASGNAERVMLAIDASGSMAARIGGETKMTAAKDAARDFLTNLPVGVEVGLIAFGHEGTNDAAGKAASCEAIEALHPLGATERTRIDDALASFDATGWTPLARAITMAGQSFAATDDPGSQLVYVVSDGEETCGGDPVSAARKLHEGNVRAVVNIIGFDLTPSDRAQLRAVAQAGGGRFVEVSTGDELRRRAAEARHQVRNKAALARSTVNNNAGIARNTVRTGAALARTRVCVNAALTREQLGLSSYLRGSGFQQSSDAQSLRAALGERHSRYRARIDRYERVSTDREQAANAELEADRKRAEDAYEAVME
jgi:Ca-activated chloride channel homolog